MKQEYLFSKEYDIEQIKECVKDIGEDYSIGIHEINDVDFYIFEIKNKSNSKEVANTLSYYNKEIISKFNVTVLSNESSAYYNKVLFPLYNEFERKLRKFLYLSSVLGKNNKEKIIQDLESKDLGEIFELLFTDSDYVQDCRKTMKQTSWNFTKKEIIGKFQELNENTLWDNLVGKKMVPTLHEKFYEVRKYRNDIMHAHNIDSDIFICAQKLITKINSELDIAIIALENTKANDIDERFNNTIYEAISKMYKNYSEKMIGKWGEIPVSTIEKIALKEYFNQFLESTIERD